MDQIDFKHFTLPNTPNYYLVCPAQYCAAAPNEISPVFSMSATDLKKLWDSMLKKQPRVKMTIVETKNNHYQYVQYSLIFRFPDYIDVEFIPLNHQQSTLAIFSRSKYGHYDFKVNEKRVKNWLTQLKNNFSKSSGETSS